MSSVTLPERPAVSSAEAQLELLMRLEQVVVETVHELVEDQELVSALVVELVAGMERVARA